MDCVGEAGASRPDRADHRKGGRYEDAEEKGGEREGRAPGHGRARGWRRRCGSRSRQRRRRSPTEGLPGGIGEPGVPPAGAAIVDAIFAATGVRVRELPGGEAAGGVAGSPVRIYRHGLRPWARPVVDWAKQEVVVSPSSEPDGGKQPGPVRTPFDETKVLERAPFVALLVLGSVFTLVGVFVSWTAVSFRLRSEVAQARVVGTETAYVGPDAATSRRIASYYPRLEFRDAGGTVHEVVGDVSRKDSSGRPGWPIGSTVRIRYEKANPDNARMGGVWSLVRHLFLLLGLGAVALAFKVRSGMQAGRNGN